MERSELINELAMALSKAQANFGAIKKTGSNPMFKSQYSTFDDVLAVVRQPLADNGLAFTQMLDTVEGAHTMTTYLMHTSGQWMSATVSVIPMAGNKGTNEVQVFGSALTYMKRYALAAMLGVAGDEDDDGNGATKATPKKPSLVQPPDDVFDSAPEVPLDDSPQLHWIDNPATRRKFWAWTRDQGLSNVDVHAALGVEHVNDFDGDKAAAVEKINHWVDNRSILDEHGA